MSKTSTPQNLLPRFALFMTAYMLCYSVLIGYSVVFLQSSGCNNTEIGIYYSVSAIICVIAQGKIGPFLDSSKKWGCWHVLTLLNILSAVFTIFLFFAHAKLVVLVLYILVGSMNLTGFTCCSNFAMEYINAGRTLNYAVSRGISSIFFAGSSLVMGYLIEGMGIRIIFPIYMLVQMLAFVALLLLPRIKEELVAKQISLTKKEEATSESHAKNASYVEFFKDKKWLLLLFISILFIYMSYTAANNFLIVIIQNVGGDSHNYGIAAALTGYLELPATLLFMTVSKKLGLQRLLGLTCFFFLCKISAFCLATQVWHVYLAQVLQFFSYSFFTPAAAYYINSILSEKDKSKGQALLGIFTIGLSGVISSMTSGILIDLFNVRTLLRFEWCLCLIGLIGVLSVFRYRNKLSS